MNTPNRQFIFTLTPEALNKIWPVLQSLDSGPGGKCPDLPASATENQINLLVQFYDEDAAKRSVILEKAVAPITDGVRQASQGSLTFVKQ